MAFGTAIRGCVEDGGSGRIGPVEGLDRRAHRHAVLPASFAKRSFGGSSGGCAAGAHRSAPSFFHAAALAVHFAGIRRDADRDYQRRSRKHQGFVDLAPDLRGVGDLHGGFLAGLCILAIWAALRIASDVRRLWPTAVPLAVTLLRPA